MTSPRETAITWQPTGDPERPYAARVAGHDWLIRLGDFPAEPLYTLLIDGVAAESFDTWPAPLERGDPRRPGEAT